MGLDRTTDRNKGDLDNSIAHAHLDDKWATVDTLSANGIEAVLFGQPYPGYRTCNSVRSFLLECQNRLTPKAFRRPFYQIPESPADFGRGRSDG